MDTDYEKIEASFGGINVTLETWVERGDWGDEPRSSLFLFHTDPITGAEYQGSLQLVEHEGGIPWVHGEGAPDEPDYIEVSTSLLEEIEAWAVENGY